MAFSGILTKIIESGTRGGLKNVLLGAGLTLASNGAFMLIVNQYIDTLRGQVGGLSADLAGLIHLTGGDIAISIVLSAIVTRLSLNPPKLSMIKGGK